MIPTTARPKGAPATARLLAEHDFSSHGLVLYDAGECDFAQRFPLPCAFNRKSGDPTSPTVFRALPGACHPTTRRRIGDLAAIVRRIAPFVEVAFAPRIIGPDDGEIGSVRMCRWGPALAGHDDIIARQSLVALPIDRPFVEVVEQAYHAAWCALDRELDENTKWDVSEALEERGLVAELDPLSRFEQRAEAFVHLAKSVALGLPSPAEGEEDPALKTFADALDGTLGATIAKREYGYHEGYQA